MRQKLKSTAGFLSKIIDPFPSMKSYWIMFFIFVIIYLFFYQGVFVNLMSYNRYDDEYYYIMAGNIGSLKWLGPYSSILLSKMPGFAIFLIFSIATHLPYLIVVGACYSIAIAFFLQCSMWLFSKAKIFSFLMGISLLFNPIFSNESRIYRNQLSAICLLIFIGALIALFNPNTKKYKKSSWIIMGFVSFLGTGFLFYTREETMLYYGMLGISTTLFLLVFKKIATLGRNLYLIGCGLTGVIVVGLLISSLNYHFYGRFTVCEKTSVPFSSALKAFQSVADPDHNPQLPMLSPSYNKIKQIAAVVPEFEKVATIMCDSTFKSFKHSSTFLDRNTMEFCNIDNCVIPPSHFEWYWISAVRKSGYYTNASDIASYYKTLSQKINEAITSGKLQKRDILISAGPYFITKGDIPTIVKVLPHNYSRLFFTQSEFESKFKNLAIRVSGKRNEINNLDFKKKLLNLKYLYLPKKTEMNDARESVYNKFWCFMVFLYSKLVVPLMHFATPLALFAVIVGIFRKQWLTVFPILIIVAGYIAHFVLLSIIDVVVGYRASTFRYFLPSYSLIIITPFLAITTLVSPFLNQNKKRGKSKISFSILKKE
ncbi:MAG TPA: hypothetical protein VJY41_07270 [Prolixibacteraceae bacterium]|nr:hypothetical protein [Prolixibacteraceae bacterium]